MDVRIVVTQVAREISLEIADDEREAVKARIEEALLGKIEVLWLKDKRGRDVAVASSKIAYVEIGSTEGERRMGFGS